jgi:hypothetical protein
MVVAMKKNMNVREAPELTTLSTMSSSSLGGEETKSTMALSELVKTFNEIENDVETGVSTKVRRCASVPDLFFQSEEQYGGEGAFWFDIRELSFEVMNSKLGKSYVSLDDHENGSESGSDSDSDSEHDGANAGDNDDYECDLSVTSTKESTSTNTRGSKADQKSANVSVSVKISDDVEFIKDGDKEDGEDGLKMEKKKTVSSCKTQDEDIDIEELAVVSLELESGDVFEDVPTEHNTTIRAGQDTALHVYSQNQYNKSTSNMSLDDILKANKDAPAPSPDSKVASNPSRCPATAPVKPSNFSAVDGTFKASVLNLVNQSMSMSMNTTSGSSLNNGNGMNALNLSLNSNGMNGISPRGLNSSMSLLNSSTDSLGLGLRTGSITPSKQHQMLETILNGSATKTTANTKNMGLNMNGNRNGMVSHSLPGGPIRATGNVTSVNLAGLPPLNNHSMGTINTISQRQNSMSGSINFSPVVGSSSSNLDSQIQNLEQLLQSMKAQKTAGDNHNQSPVVPSLQQQTSNSSLTGVINQINANVQKERQNSTDMLLQQIMNGNNSVNSVPSVNPIDPVTGMVSSTTSMSSGTQNLMNLVQPSPLVGSALNPQAAPFTMSGSNSNKDQLSKAEMYQLHSRVKETFIPAEQAVAAAAGWRNVPNHNHFNMPNSMALPMVLPNGMGMNMYGMNMGMNGMPGMNGNGFAASGKGMTSNGLNASSPLMGSVVSNNGKKNGGSVVSNNAITSPGGSKVKTSGKGGKEKDSAYINQKKKDYLKKKQMSVFHYTLRHARQYSKINMMSLEWNFNQLEEKRRIDLKNGVPNMKPNLVDGMTPEEIAEEKKRVEKERTDEEIAFLEEKKQEALANGTASLAMLSSSPEGSAPNSTVGSAVGVNAPATVTPAAATVSVGQSGPATPPTLPPIVPTMNLDNVQVQ